VRVKGISWVGVGTDRYPETYRLFTEILGLEVETGIENQAILRTPNGQQVELFGRDGPGRGRNTPPTVAFEVDETRAAGDELAAAGIEIVGEIGSWEGHEWLYFRSPDGYLFEVKSSPATDN
jgi:catechol 2,3-dioxygenase-like lactoylglutathione lyase family enzyme